MRSSCAATTAGRSRTASRASCRSRARQRRCCTGTTARRPATPSRAAGRGAATSTCATRTATYIYAGRSDDMLKVSGIYVSPFEVESTLMQHPAVLEAAVIGGRDDEGLTKTKAFVVLKPGRRATDAELKALVKDKLAPYKYPRDRVRRRTTEDRDGQDPAFQAARTRDCSDMRAGRCERSMMTVKRSRMTVPCGATRHNRLLWGTNRRLMKTQINCAAAMALVITFSGYATAASPGTPEIIVLSNRADLISGGDALVEIKVPAALNPAYAKIALNGTLINSMFALRANGKYKDRDWPARWREYADRTHTWRGRAGHDHQPSDQRPHPACRSDDAMDMRNACPHACKWRYPSNQRERPSHCGI